jgi:shikimate kinase
VTRTRPARRPAPSGPTNGSALSGDTRPIVLVGMMGSGKSSVGRRLAARLGLRFFDADDEIEAAAGRSIADIFADYGETQFRDGERRVIARLLDQGRCVIATGGGAFAQPQTRTLIKERGLSVWLDVPVPVLVDRVSRRNHRPLLRDKDPAMVLTGLLKEREPAYAEAAVHIRSSATPHSRAVDAIIAALAGRTA